MRTKPSTFCLPLPFSLLISLNHVPNPLSEPLSNDMKPSGKCAGDIKDGNAVDENIDDAKMTLTR